MVHRLVEPSPIADTLSYLVDFFDTASVRSALDRPDFMFGFASG